MAYRFSEGLGRVVEIDDSSGCLLVCKPGNDLTSVSMSDAEIDKFFDSDRRPLSESEAEALNRSLAARNFHNPKTGSEKG